MLNRYSKKKAADVWSDQEKFTQWNESCLAVLWAQCHTGQIDQTYGDLIERNLGFNLERVEELDQKFKQDAQALIEASKEHLLTQGLGEEVVAQYGNGITSYDMEDPSTVILIAKAIALLKSELKRNSELFRDRAKEFKYTKYLAITHGQPAGVNYLGIKFCNYIAMLDRDYSRVSQSIEDLGVGKFSGAYGINDELDPAVEAMACESLGLSVPRINTQIIHRDQHAAVMSTLMIMAGNIEHIANNLWQMCHYPRNEARTYFDPINQRGSTAMPHKNNPWRLERLRGMASLIRGYGLAVMENIRTWDERAIDQSSVERVVWADSTILLHFMLIELHDIFTKMEFFPENMIENINKLNGLHAAQYVKNALRRKGIANLNFTNPEGEVKSMQTYDYVKWCSLTSWDWKRNRSGRSFKQVLKEQGILEHLTFKELNQCFNTDHILRNVDSIYEKFDV